MEIRLFKETDRQAVIELWQTCGLTRPWNCPDADMDRKLLMQPELFFVGEINQKVVASAMAGYDGHRGSVYYLAVLPEFQKAGLGGQLMQHIENSLVAMGCPKLNILVRTSNENVLAFYQQLGYSADDVTCLGKRLISDV